MDAIAHARLLQQTRALRASDRRAWTGVLVETLLVGAGIFLSLHSWGTWILGQLLLFVCVWRAFAILHSCAHNAFFQTRSLNRVFGWVFSLWAFVPFDGWKKSHLEHHKWTGTPERDPSLQLPKAEELSPGFLRFLDWAWRLHIPIFSVLFTLSKLSQKKRTRGCARPDSAVPAAPRDGSAIFWLLMHLAALFLLGLAYLKLLLVPFMLYLFTSDFLVISQHNGVSAERGLPAPATLVPSKRPEAFALREHDLFTRTLRFPRWVSAGVFLYFDKHTLHHFAPFIPHYCMPEACSAPDAAMINEVPWYHWVKENHRRLGREVYLELLVELPPMRRTL